MVWKPGETVFYRLDLTNVFDVPEEIPMLNGEQPEIYSFFSRPCEKGEEYTEDYKCIDCPSGYYSFTPLTEPGPCPPCPQYGICKDKQLFPRQGYMRMC